MENYHNEHEFSPLTWLRHSDACALLHFKHIFWHPRIKKLAQIIYHIEFLCNFVSSEHCDCCFDSFCTINIHNLPLTDNLQMFIIRLTHIIYMCFTWRIHTWIKSNVFYFVYCLTKNLNKMRNKLFFCICRTKFHYNVCCNH